ncbi:ADP-ribosylation factor-like protein 2 [Dimargaris xerosporica]|nr:ADP-ribosylation factor-like protein 2 [Dimargaris xerosporica]
MGLHTILRKNRQREREMRLLVLGLDNAGKTTILKKLNGDPIDTISPTLGFNIITLAHRDYKLNFWDVGGQKSIRSYWRNYFEQTDGVVWVVDSADQRRLEACRQELGALLKEERLAGASLLVLANKQDIAGAVAPADLIQRLALPAITTHHWRLLECSAVTGQNLLQGIDWVVEDIASRIYMYD